MKLKRIYKTLKKTSKELKWRRYKFKVIIKRIEKKNRKSFVELKDSLHKSFDLLGNAIEEIETGLKNLRNVVIQNGLNVKSEILYTPMRGDEDVYELLLYSIKLNLKPEMLIIILRSCFLKKKILILLEDRLAYLKDVIMEFFDFIFEDSFEKQIETVTKSEYMKKEVLFNDYIILTDKLISLENKNSIVINETKFEEKIVRDYYREPDIFLGRNNLRYKLQELYTLSKALLEHYKKKNNILVPKAAIKHLEDIYFLKIKKDYFYFLVGIVKSYFEIDIKYAKDYVSEQIALMMRE